MAMRGQRFHIDLSSDDETDTARPFKPRSTAASIVGPAADIVERPVSVDPKPPSLPRIYKSTTGFPAHRKRAGQPTFKQGRVGPEYERGPSVNLSNNPVFSLNRDKLDIAAKKEDDVSRKSDERQSIDKENQQRIAKMSPEEVENAKKELLSGLKPSLIERLLKKANIDDETKGLEVEPPSNPPGEKAPNTENPPKRVDFLIPDATQKQNPALTSSLPTHDSSVPDPDLAPTVPPSDLLPASSTPAPFKPHSSHASTPPALDPSSPSFLSDLHQAYFPSLPANPASLTWMTPLPPSSSSPYSPSNSSLPPSALRFDFRGHLLPPRLAAQLPPTKGLHHHSSAPEAAGYTVPELAHLARSAVASQRCVAYQTLGRVLYRLGRGDFGREGEDLCEGLWMLMDEGKVLDILVAEAGRGDEGNRSCWVTATEAVWLWRKGGGRRWKAE